MIDSDNNLINKLKDKISDSSDVFHQICEEHYTMTNRAFKASKPDNFTLDITNYDDVTYHNAKPFFAIGTGKYIAIKLLEIDPLKYFVFYAKGVNITHDNLSIKTIFDFDQRIEVNKIYSNWKIIRPFFFCKNRD